MAQLSPARERIPLIPGLKLHSRGKVRDTYELEGNRLLVVATDAVSVFDFVLNDLVPEKGSILTAMSHFWLAMLEQVHGVRTHFVCAGADVDRFLPRALRGDVTLQARSMVVERLVMHPVEFVVRACLTGTGYRDYATTGMVCGHELSPGLQNGDKLKDLLFTPTTKSKGGHDEPLDADETRQKYPRETSIALDCFRIVALAAAERGVMIADTKLEFGTNRNGEVVLGDEAFTPDSSRLWDYALWLETRMVTEGRTPPPPFDKQLVRDYAITQGVSGTLQSTNEEDLLKAWSLRIPARISRATTQTYRYIFWRLTGLTREDYFRDRGVDLPRPKKRLAIVVGSESDLPMIAPVLQEARENRFLAGFAELPRLHVISCHRNPRELREFAEVMCRGADAVICAGNKALALPGMLDAELRANGHDIPVIGVALGRPGSRALEAAELSIRELPGEPVIMDEIRQEVYTGLTGFVQALKRVARGELPPPKLQAEKPAQYNIIY